MQVLSNETYYLALIIFTLILFIMSFIIFASLKFVFILAKRNIEAKQMGNSTNLARKIEHAQFTVQD